MRKLLGLFFIVCFVSHAFCQNNLPPVYEIKKDSPSGAVYIPDSSWQMLEDTEGKWTINEVSELPLAGNFHANSPIRFSVNRYWVRYRLKNYLQHDVKIYLANASASFLDVFIKQDDSGWQQKRTGYLLPWSKRDGFKDVLMIPMSIGPGQELLIYERMKFELSLYAHTNIPVYFGFTEKLHGDTYHSETEYWKALRYGFLIGICLLAAIFCFLFFMATGEWVYFHASMMDLTIALFNFFDPFRDILFREHQELTDFGFPVVIAFFLYFTSSTFRIALDTRHLFPRLNKFLFGLGVLPFLALVVVFGFKAHFAIYYALASNTVLIFLTILITCLAVMRRKNKAAKFLITAVLFFAAYQIIELTINMLGLTPPRWYQERSLDIEALCTFWLIIVTLGTLFARYRQLQKKLVQEAFDKEQLAKEKEIERRQLIEQQKLELEKTVEERTAELKQSLQELKSTQAQLIQSEKMASLGELTAGIAHEIQNPLNFVNNFSEVNNELIEELKIENGKLKIENNVGSGIIDDIYQNNEKVIMHGKRADAIVKGMLQHSRTATGQKELTDINALCDEYLRLAYHGLRAKDKNFNADIETEFDNSIGKINIVPQEIGRVLLNLINNAFYAVNEKVKLQAASLPTGQAGYKPQVLVTTKRPGDKILISVKDNGNGIPETIIDKIFQPFFTTKPTGQGTGLGLSLAYDIVKAHGGELSVKTKEGEGSEFIVQLAAT